MNELGRLDHVLQMGVYWGKNDDNVKLSQKKHIEKIAVRFGVENAKPKYQPMSPEIDLKVGGDRESQYPYLELLGSLLWIARCTRPDIQFAVNYLAQFSHCYQSIHFTALKQVAKYLHTTRDL